jgi:hypothetical protein
VLAGADRGHRGARRQARDVEDGPLALKKRLPRPATRSRAR